MEPDWGDIYKRLVQMGRNKGLNVADAKEAAQEALRRHFDPDYARWDPARYPTLLLFLGSVMNGVISDRRQRERTRKNALMPEPRASSSFERASIDRDLAEVAVAKLLERTAHDDLVQRIVLQVLQGVDGAAEQAAALGVDVREVYNARERLKVHRAAIAAELEKDPS